jgi:hypothetical protein
LPRYAALIVGLTIKALSKCVRLRIDGEVHRHHNRVFILIVSVPCGLAPMFLEPFSHRNNRGRKILAG